MYLRTLSRYADSASLPRATVHFNLRQLHPPTTTDAGGRTFLSYSFVFSFELPFNTISLFLSLPRDNSPTPNLLLLHSFFFSHTHSVHKYFPSCHSREFTLLLESLNVCGDVTAAGSSSFRPGRVHLGCVWAIICRLARCVITGFPPEVFLPTCMTQSAAHLVTKSLLCIDRGWGLQPIALDGGLMFANMSFSAQEAQEARSAPNVIVSVVPITSYISFCWPPSDQPARVSVTTNACCVRCKFVCSVLEPLLSIGPVQNRVCL